MAEITSSPASGISALSAGRQKESEHERARKHLKPPLLAPQHIAVPLVEVESEDEHKLDERA